jgi:hypothetical protein
MIINLIALSYLASVVVWGIYVKKKVWNHKLDEIELSVVVSFCMLWIVILPLLLVHEKRKKKIIQKKKQLEELVK